LYDAEALHLPRGPVSSITSITDGNGVIYDSADEAPDADAFSLTRVGNSDRITLARTATYPITVVYVVGHATAAEVPADIKGAIRTHIATRYVIREAVHEGSLTPVTNLDEFYRLRGRGSPVQ
jgi:hypothetical protein